MSINPSLEYSEENQLSQDYESLKKSMNIPNPFPEVQNLDQSNQIEVLHSDINFSTYQKLESTHTQGSLDAGLETARSDKIEDYFANNDQNEKSISINLPNHKNEDDQFEDMLIEKMKINSTMHQTSILQDIENQDHVQQSVITTTQNINLSNPQSMINSEMVVSKQSSAQITNKEVLTPGELVDYDNQQLHVNYQSPNVPDSKSLKSPSAGHIESEKTIEPDDDYQRMDQERHLQDWDWKIYMAIIVTLALVYMNYTQSRQIDSLQTKLNELQDNQTAEFNHIYEEEKRLEQEIGDLNEPMRVRDKSVTLQQRIDALFAETPIFDLNSNSNSKAIKKWKSLDHLTLEYIQKQYTNQGEHMMLDLDEQFDTKLIPGISYYTGQMYENQAQNKKAVSQKDSFIKQGFGRLTVYNTDDEFKIFSGIYEGQWNENHSDGFGRYIHANGSWYEGFWLQGNMHGFGTFHSQNGTIETGQWIQNKFQE